jgi:hypothetical protein
MKLLLIESMSSCVSPTARGLQVAGNRAGRRASFRLVSEFGVRSRAGTTLLLETESRILRAVSVPARWDQVQEDLRDDGGGHSLAVVSFAREKGAIR